MLNDEWDTEYQFCPSCEGAGGYAIGDCEDGVIATCPECDGYGEVEVGKGIDVFNPKRDAWTPND